MPFREYPKATLGTDNEFVDLLFPIGTIKSTSTDGREFKLYSTLNGKKVGFEITLNTEWKQQRVSDTDTYFYWGSGSFKSLGKISDHFLHELAALYTIEIEKERFIKEIPVEVVILSGSPEAFDKLPIRSKFFLNSSDEKLYSEVFINWDIPNKVLAFNEKDQEYREPLITSLIQQR